jgi:hypothetical protein
VPFNASDQNDCIACHNSQYQAEHGGTTIPTTCLTCHNINTWAGATIDHPALSGGFQLVGAHVSIACESCHSGPGFSVPFNASSQNDCFACHSSDYQSEHAGTGFPTTCLTCHNVDTWAGATIDHPALSGGFQLVGAHVSIACERCHSGPGFSVPFDPAGHSDCYACHASDYDNEHSGTGFSTNCLSCHNTDTWEGASFDHDAQFFPIYSGEHRGEWSDCQDCHTAAPSDFTVFSCLNCHEHRQSEMDDEHDEVSGYVYESNACLSCHPNGDEGS